MIRLSGCIAAASCAALVACASGSDNPADRV